MSTSASSMPAPQEQPSFLAAVRGLCHLIYSLDKPNEMKVAAFVFEHTICYQEFDTAKKITLDEFVNGRKLKNGERFSPGCGISQRIHASRALAGLQDRKALKIVSDEKDGARSKKFYRLTLPSLPVDVSKADTVTLSTVSKVDTSDEEAVSETDTPCINNGYPEYLKLIPDQSKYLEKVPEVSTSIAPTVEPSIIAPDGAAIAVREDELTVREKEDSAALVPLAEPSHSLTPDNAPGDRLHETNQTPEREVSPELESLWNLVKTTLRANVGEAAYDNHIAPLKVAGCEGPILYLQSRTTFTAEHFQARFATQASGILSQFIHKEAEIRCLPPPRSAAAALDTILISEPEPPTPEPDPEPPLTLKALVARDLFHFPPTGWNKGAAKAVQNAVNQLQEVHVTAENAPQVIQYFKRQRPNGSVYEFLTKLPALVAALGIQA